MIVSIISLVVAYIVGGLPMGVLIGKFVYKTDIRNHGSGNIGMGNAYRTFGPFGGVVVLGADIAKGALAVWTARHLVSLGGAQALLSPESLVALAGMAAVYGASYSIFLKFSGGKSVGAATGVVLSLFPKTILILMLAWFITVGLTRYISAGAIAVSLVLPFGVFFLYPGTVNIVVAGAIALLIVYRHKENLERIVAGNERRFSLMPKREAS